MKFNRQTFFDSYRVNFGNLNPTQISGLEKLLDFADVDQTITDLRWLAYMLATVKHECADTYHPIQERGHKSYFDKYETGTAIGARLGNTEQGDGYLFRGRGYVQITGRANYKRLSASLALPDNDNLVTNPDRSLTPEIAYKIMSFGMVNGSFTGKKLKDYINSFQVDYKQARRIINVMDQADKIKDYAVKFESILKESLITDNKKLISEEEKNKLFENNINEINKMYVSAGSLVKNLIMELERDNRNTFIRLHDAVMNGHLIHYDFVEGDADLVIKIANALGFKNVTSELLEVRDA